MNTEYIELELVRKDGEAGFRLQEVGTGRIARGLVEASIWLADKKDGHTVNCEFRNMRVYLDSQTDDENNKTKETK